MKKEYDTYVKELDSLPQGKEVDIFIRELTPGRQKYYVRHVQAQVADSPGKLPDSDVLRIRFWNGNLYDKPWAIKILKESPL